MASTAASELLVGSTGNAATRPVRRDWLPFLLSFPTLLVVFLVIGLPLIYSLALSLFRINMLTRRWIFVGLQNYTSIIPQADFIAAMGPHRRVRRDDRGGRAGARHGDGAGLEHAVFPAVARCARSSSSPGRWRR